MTIIPALTEHDMRRFVGKQNFSSSIKPGEMMKWQRQNYNK